MLQDVIAAMIAILAYLVNQDFLERGDLLFVTKHVEMVKDLFFLVMMEITSMEMVVVQLVRLNKDIIVKEDQTNLEILV